MRSSWRTRGGPRHPTPSELHRPRWCTADRPHLALGGLLLAGAPDRARGRGSAFPRRHFEWSRYLKGDRNEYTKHRVQRLFRSWFVFRTDSLSGELRGGQPRTTTNHANPDLHAERVNETQRTDRHIDFHISDLACSTNRHVNSESYDRSIAGPAVLEHEHGRRPRAKSGYRFVGQRAASRYVSGGNPSAKRADDHRRRQDVR